MVTRLRIDLAYDGSPFSGFARQPGRRTVQGTLEDACARLFAQDVRTTCAGRTDRGVHAIAQVVHLDVDTSDARVARLVAAPDVARTRVDALVGHEITIWRVRAVGPHFDARFSATERRYRYRLVDAAASDPIRRHDRWVVGEPLDVPAMRAAARHLLGEHDFASFCRRAEGRTTVRELRSVTVHRPAAGRVDVVFAGNAFCHQQVRSLVGCLVDVGLGRRPADWVAEVLAARDRAVASRVAPPYGLTLERVSYGPGVPAAPPVGVTR